MVSEHLAQDRYVTETTVISCSDRHASLQARHAMSVDLTTSRTESRDANHYATKSPNVGLHRTLTDVLFGVESPRGPCNVVTLTEVPDGFDTAFAKLLWQLFQVAFYVESHQSRVLIHPSI